VKVLVACEFSEIVKEQFLNRGHDAHSCDLLPGEKGLKNHHKADVLSLLGEGWDLMIAHPPCTHLACSGARWFKDKQAEQKEAIGFFMSLANAPVNRLCIENPVCIMSSVWRKPDQIIQPWQFGENFQKTTCLWLKNLPKLLPTKIVNKGEFVTFSSGRKMPKWYADARVDGHRRSRTFVGIAHAMADQWGHLKNRQSTLLDTSLPSNPKGSGIREEIL